MAQSDENSSLRQIPCLTGKEQGTIAILEDPKPDKGAKELDFTAQFLTVSRHSLPAGTGNITSTSGNVLALSG